RRSRVRPSSSTGRGIAIATGSAGGGSANTSLDVVPGGGRRHPCSTTSAAEMNALTRSPLHRSAQPTQREAAHIRDDVAFAQASPYGPLAEAIPASAELGFYVHVPFCRKRCYYCSFNTAPLEDRASVDRYVRSVVTEIGLLATAPLNQRRPIIATVFLGGGTPSLLEPEELAAILEAIRDGFVLAPDVEITVEANPE